LRLAKLILPFIAVFGFALVSDAWAAGGGTGTGGNAASQGSGAGTASGASPAATQSGGVGVGAPPPGVSTPTQPIVAGAKAKIISGIAYAPSYAPLAVQQAIWAGDQIHMKPYIAVHYASLAWLWPGYDCSGSVSYVLYKAGLLSSSPDVSGDFESYGRRGKGRWITVWGSGGHAFIEVAGIVFDTAQYASVAPVGSGPRWQPASIIAQQLADGNAYSVRHPIGF
jgi:hypothetical protein